HGFHCETGGLNVEQTVQRVTKRFNAGTPAIVEWHRIIRIVETVQQRHIHMTDKGDGAPRVCQQALGQRGDEIFPSVEPGNHRLPMMKVTLRGCPIAKTGELEKDSSF